MSSGRTTSSEEVLLIVKNVKLKKSDGCLYLMGERIAWMAMTKNTFTVSHNYTDIRVQKISPETKEKIQLQVVLHTSGANTFQFTNPAGREAQKRDREAVKEMLQQLLPKFRRKISSELEEKNRVLQENPELYQLYLDLVVSGVVTADEFWDNHCNSHKNNKTHTQPVGISAAFLADIKPVTDGCNGLKYNLTTDIIESVFKTYPAVKQKHLQLVPGQLTDSEFWTRFFQSHYFHRDRFSFTSKDLFADCAKNDDKEIEQELSRPAQDAMLDMTSMSDFTLGEEYGSTQSTKQSSGNLANASLLKRFNQHSTMVLKTTTQSTPQNNTTAEAGASDGGSNGTAAAAAASTSAAALSNGTHNASDMNEDDGQPQAKKAKLREKVAIEDLHTTGESSVHDGAVAGPSGVGSSTGAPRLSLMQTERYLHGPTQQVAVRYETHEDLLRAEHVLSQEVRGWTPKLTEVLHTSTAVSVLGELSPGGELMKITRPQQLHQLLPTDMHTEVTHMYAALAELLRHFWACFPVSTPQLEEKVKRMRKNLDNFTAKKLAPLKEKLQYNHYAYVVLHLERMLESAYAKYNTWQAKKSKKSR